MATARKAVRRTPRKKAAERELINAGRAKLYVRRPGQGDRSGRRA